MASVPFNNLITFSRGTNATLTGSNGLIQYAPNNLLTFSEQFDNASWTKNATTVLANSTVAPDGTSTADTVTPSTANSAHNIYASFTYTATTYTLSVYVKPNGYSWVKLGSMFTGQGVFFDVSNGVVGTANAGYTGTIIAAGNGWYRCSVTQTAAAGADLPGLYVASSGSVVSFAGNGTSGIFLWGAQLELGSTATTYNPTTVKNLLGFSEAFDNAAWTKSNASIVTGAQANPVNGAFNAQKLMENTAAGTHYALQSVSVLAAPYALSVYAKAGERSFVSFGFDGLNAWFNLSTGVLGTVEAGLTASIVSVGSGWYRCSVFRTVAVAGSKSCVVYPANANGVVSYTGDGNSGVYIYGAQLSDSASLDAYVPTPGAAPSSTAYYGPRFDYDPVTLAPKGILVEEARTNLLTYSEQFDNGIWQVLSGATKTANTTVSPDGTTNADTITATSNSSGVYQTQTASNSTVYTTAAYFKAGTGSEVRFGLTNQNESANAYYAFTLAGAGSFVSFSITGFTATSASITSAGNGWYRCVVTGTSPASGTTAVGPMIRLSAAGTAFVWGAQLEAGAFATSYIPTIASTVTRSADVATITGSLFSQWYGQPQGTFVAAFDMAGGSASFANNRAVLVARESATSSHNIYNGSGQVTGWTVVSGVDQAYLTTGAVAADTVTNIAYAYKANDFAASRNGGTVATDTSGTLPTPTVFGIGSNSAGSLFLSGHIQSIQYYPVRAADFQLQALTT